MCKKYCESDHGAATKRNWGRFYRAGLPTSAAARKKALDRGELDWDTMMELTR